ncbi:MAG: beta-ketoacyl synthase N-terminal-like domain-containing protein [Candidatus Marithrix sp.]
MDNIESSIAIIGMAGRFPGAKNITEFWENIKNGVESITSFSDEELLEAGIDPELLKQPDYVKAKGMLDDIAGFDANFFGFTPKDASITDPQQRLFLECAWEALEDAGYDTNRYSGDIGIYGGAGGFDTYFLKNLANNAEIMDTVGNYQVTLSNDKDFLCTRTAYKLNLTGPAVTVQTACSTSLVAIIQACQSLLHYQCDMVLAGGACITMPNKAGYLYQTGMIMSPDGHCRAFDANAQGIVDGNGVGIVVLKRLEEALEDKDNIYAVIRGSHINNDGAAKMNYTSPSIEGQTKVIEEALATAEVDPETITYVEAHGTGTALGDPIEIAALTQAYNTDKTGYCAIGSVKTNVGHLDIASGVTGLIKATLALKHQQIPPSLHYESPNPEIDFANSPFYVNTELSEWQTDGIPRRAGVSSFGIGGTNAHMILEEAPPVQSAVKSRPSQLLLISAKTDSALETYANKLVEYLQQHPDLNLADVAYTYQIGRRDFSQRKMLIGNDIKAMVNCQSITATANTINSVVFMFSGQGSQYANMGLELYQTEIEFREQVDYCCQVLQPHLGIDLRLVLYPTTNTGKDINQTVFSQPALFVIEYALAKLWMSWGVQPSAMIGHSIGEYVAACLAGVFTLDEALLLVASRGRLMQSVPKGSMLAVPLTEKELQPLLTDGIDLAVINIASQCVISGTEEVLELFATQLLADKGLECKLLYTSHAFHSEMMQPILPAFLEQVEKVNLQPPQIAYLSNVSGTWITSEEATDPNYWVQHLRQTVRFADGLQELVTEAKYILLEVGPGRTLSSFAKRHPERVTGQVVLTSLRQPNDEISDSSFLIKTLGQLWLNGIKIDWTNFYAKEQRQRLSLPTYPFERQKYWIEASTKIIFEKIDDLKVLRNEKTVALNPQKKLDDNYVSPRNETEQKITEIWQQFLGIENIDIHDDYFELGGDSLLAVQLIAKLCQIFQIKLPSNILLSSSTIAKLTQSIKNPSLFETQSSVLVKIQTGKSFKNPLFLIHPVGGQVYFYRHLAIHLGAEQPVYGLQAQGIDGEKSPLTSVEEMATQYIAALRVVQPNGPYLLGGSSFGGTVAFEMAQQLHKVNQKVNLLALIDTPKELPDIPLSDIDILIYLLEVGGSIEFDLSQLRQLSSEEQLKYFVEHSQFAKEFTPDTALEQIRNFLYLFKINVQALQNYKPRSYSGEILFFKARDLESDLNVPNPEQGWHNIATMKIYEIPGNHITMNYSPHVEVMADHIKKYLI